MERDGVSADIDAGEGVSREMVRDSRAKTRRRIAVRTILLVAGLLAVVGAILYLADVLRGIVLGMALVDRGEWASLLGGGLGAWAFFLVRSGIVENAFDLAPKAKAVLESLPMRPWRPFLESAASLSRTLVLPGLVTAFALVFVGGHVRDQILAPSPSPVSMQIEATRQALELRLDAIDRNLVNVDLHDALEARGYTPERAARLDLVGADDPPSDYYFARFAVAFDPASLNEAGTEFVSGAEYDADANLDLVSRLVNALTPCGAVENPVILRVEGYASSESFGNAAENVSDALNVRLANTRRHAVAAALNAAMAGTGLADAQRRILIEEAEDYRTIAEMRADREFDDRPGGGNANRLPQDVFTRAAHIKILNLGTCRVRSGWGR